MRERLVVGCMTGTSCDGIDAALVRLSGEGLAMKATVVRHLGRPLESLGAMIRGIASGDAVTAECIAEVGWWFGLAHTTVIEELIGDQSVDLIAVHGQTLFHAPPLSWQWINPHPIARRFNAPVVFDLRGADLAAGGQGAPITPLADWILFRARIDV